MYNFWNDKKNLDPYRTLNIIPKFDIFNCYFNRYRVDLSTSNLSMYYRSCYLDIHYTYHVNRYRVDLSISNLSMYYRSCYLDIHIMLTSTELTCLPATSACTTGPVTQIYIICTYHVNRYRVDLSISHLSMYYRSCYLDIHYMYISC